MFDVKNLERVEFGLCRHYLKSRYYGLLLVLMILVAGVSGCRLNTPDAQEVTPTETQSPVVQTSPLATSYPGPASDVDTAPTGYPAPELVATDTGVVYPGPLQSQSAPPSSTIPPSATALPTPSPTADLPGATPLSIDPSPGSYPAPQAPVMLTPTALGYPGPEFTPLPETPSLQGAATSSPYPGPAPTITPLQIATQTLPATRIVVTATVVVDTPTPTLSPTVVRTVFQASNPADFRLVSLKYQMVTFYATWSPESDVMAPVIYNLEGKYENRINFVYLNLDDPANSIFKEMLKSQLPPAFYLLDPQGRVVDSWFGRVSLPEIDAALSTISP